MIILFDLDSTLTKIEGLDEIAKWKGMEQEIAELTRLGMSGNGSFEDLLPVRLDKIAPTKSDFERLGELYAENLVEGAMDAIMNLRKNKIHVGIMSGGFIHALDPLIEILNVNKELVFANKIEFDEGGNYVRLPENQFLTKNDGKPNVIKHLKEKFPQEKVVFVGDSVRDLDTVGIADKFIGFGGVIVYDQVKFQAPYYIYNFAELMDVLEA